MNQDSQPLVPNDPESRLTAWLLGELGPDDAAVLAKEVEQDAALRLLRDRLAGTIHFVRCAAARPVERQAGEVPQPKLSSTRREKLLAAFKVVSMPRPNRPRYFGLTRREWLMTIAASVVLVAIGVGMLLPSLATAKSKSQRIAALQKNRAVEEGRRLGLDLGRAPAPPGFAEKLGAVEGAVAKSPNSEPAPLASTRLRDPAKAEKVEIFLPPKADELALAAGDAEARPRLDPAMVIRYGLLPKGVDFEKLQQAAEGEKYADRSGGTSVGVGAARDKYLFDATRAGQAPSGITAGSRFSTAGAGAFRYANTNQIAGGGMGGGAGGGGFGGFGGGGGASGDGLAALGGFPAIATREPAAREDRRYSVESSAPVQFWGDFDRNGVVAQTEQQMVREQLDTTLGRRNWAASVPAGGVVAANDVVATTDLAPVPINLPTPAFMGTPTDLPSSERSEARLPIVAGKPAVAPAPTAHATPPPSESAAVEREDLARGATVAPVRDLSRADAGRSVEGRQRVELDAKAKSGAAPGPGPVVVVPPAAGAVEFAIQPEAQVQFGLRSAGRSLAVIPPPVPSAGTAAERQAGEAARAGLVPRLGDMPTLGKRFAAPTDELSTAKKDVTASVANGPESESRVHAGELVEGVELSLQTALAVPAAAGEPEPAPAAAGVERKLTDLMTGVDLRANAVEALGGQTQKRGFASSTAPTASAPTAEAFSADGRQLGYAVTRAQIATQPTDMAERRAEPAPAATERLAEHFKEIAPERPRTPPPVPQPEVMTSENAFSTFSLNVADVSFKLAAASLDNGQLPDPGAIRSEEFVNAFDYRDAQPSPGMPIGFTWERARYPFAHNRELIRFAVRTAAVGREASRPLNLVLLLDNSGSMERADRVAIIREALAVLAGQLHPQDMISVVAFARTARLWVDGLPGSQASELVDRVGNLVPEGGTNLEDALGLAYDTAARHFLVSGVNRVVLLTDGAANLGDVRPEMLRQRVESWRRRGVALDCFGIGWEGYNDDLLEVLSRNGDGRYGFINSPEEATSGFASQLAGALKVAASDVKVQVEFNPRRVNAWRQVGYAKHQLTKEQFRDNTVDAAELGAAEAGNGLYVIEVNPEGQGDVGVVRARYREPGTSIYRELEWPLAYAGNAVALEQASPTLKLAATAAAFAEALADSPFAGDVTCERLLSLVQGVPAQFAPDPRAGQLEQMIRQAKSLGAK